MGVGVYLMNAAAIDIANGLWTMEAMVYFYNQTNGTFSPQMPVVANSGGSPYTLTVISNLGATNFLTRLVFKPNPNQYPFDTQSLELAIEDANGTSIDTLQYYFMPSYSGISDQLRLRGWNWNASDTGQGVSRVRTYFGGHQVSQLSWTFNITRAKVVAVQVLLPPCFVLVSVLISFIMPITSSITRIGIVGSALISEVSLHSGIKQANGTTGTLGLIDYFFILTYLILVISLTINVLVMILLRQNEKSPLATYLESRTKYFVWLVCPGLYTFIFFKTSLLWAAFMCLLGPVLIYIAVDRSLPSFRALRRRLKTAEKKKKEDEFNKDEEMQAQIHDEEGQTDGDSKAAVIAQELKNRRAKTQNQDGSSFNLYDTDSE